MALVSSVAISWAEDYGVGGLSGLLSHAFCEQGWRRPCISMAHRFEYTDRLSQETQNTALQRERERDRVVLSILSTEACHNVLFYGTFCIKTLNWVTHNENYPEFSSWQGSKWAISQNTMRTKKYCVIDWSTCSHRLNHLSFVILVLYNHDSFRAVRFL